MTLKAYSVLEEDENTGGIVFAKSSAEARRVGSAMFGDGDFNWGKARREPWADEFAPGPVPFKAKFERGWWQECFRCGCVMREGECDDDGNEIDFDIVEVGDRAYCTPRCREFDVVERAEVKRIEQFIIGELIDHLLRKMPGAIVCGWNNVYVPRGPWPLYPRSGLIDFVFPGGKFGKSSLRFDKAGEQPRVTVPKGDCEAFYRWSAAGYPPHMMDAAEVES